MANSHLLPTYRRLQNLQCHPNIVLVLEAKGIHCEHCLNTLEVYGFLGTVKRSFLLGDF